jgi:hypothetical protein
MDITMLREPVTAPVVAVEAAICAVLGLGYLLALRVEASSRSMKLVIEFD